MSRPGKPVPARGARGRVPGLPDDAPARLAQALSALGLTLPPSREPMLLAHLALLARWNATHNLTAVRDPAEMLVQHCFDCLAIVPPLRDAARMGRDHLADGAVVLDVGSGGALPGAVLAICAPGVQVHCVDAVAKKAAFIRQLRAELGLANLHAHHARLTAEGERGQPVIAVPPVTLAVSRAFGSLADFIRLSLPLMADTGVWVAMKGLMPDDELRELPQGVNVSAAITLAVPQMHARRHLLLLERRGAPAAA